MIPATKEKILDAAIQVFNEDPSAPLQKVADAAGVTRRTLHRYFKDRQELVNRCENTMEVRCKQAMIVAIQSSDEPREQLKNMLFAGIDCGAKYAFFYKLHRKKDHRHTESNQNCADYNYIYGQFDGIVKTLQQRGVVNADLSTEWVQLLHAGIIAGTVTARDVTEKKLGELKSMAWNAFTKAIAG